MTVNRRPAAELAYRLADQERRIKALARKPQLANSSLENGALEEYDADGNLSSIIGTQHDGTHGAVTVNGPVPPVPVVPTVEVVPGVITVRWSGKFEEDETSPLDFKHVSVHVLQLGEYASPENQRATIRGELGDVATITAEPGVYFVSLLSWSTAGKFSAPSESVEIYVPDLTDTDALSQELVDAREEIESTRIELDGRLIAASQDLAAHEERLATAEGELTTLENEILPALEADLANAKETLDGLPAQLAESGQKIDAATGRLDTLENETLPGLSGQISSAQSRLSAAESTLAPLPGQLSEAKADLTEAFGELSTVDSRISSAKDSAISTAAADAQAKADAARADANAQIAQIIARGQNLVRNGDFEAGGDGWNLNASSSVTSANFRSGTRSLSVSNIGDSNAWPTSEWVPSSTGRSYYFEYWVREGGTPDNLKRIGAVAQIKRADGTTASNTFAMIASADVPNYQWVKISGTVTISQSDIVGVRFAPWFEGPTSSSYNVDDVLAVDVTEAQEALTAAANAQADATKALTNAGTAQAAADAALTMAGSKSKVYYSLNGPSGTASPGDTWRQVDSKNNVIAEWRVTASGAWVSQEITTSMIANLDVGKLTAGSAEINSAVINKLAVGIATVIQLNADTITSGKLTSAQINTSDLAASLATIIQLNANRITAGTIDAARLNIADLSARIATIIQLDASRITAGTINTARLNASEIAAKVATVIQLNASRITAGTINTARLNASEIAAATAAFQRVDIKNLFVSTGTIAEAVIEKLWVEVVRSRKITTDMLLVGTDGNLFPNGAGELGGVAGEWWATRLTADSKDKPDGIANSFKSTVGSGTVQGGYDFVEVTPGREYLFEIWVKASKPNSRIYIELRDQNGAHAMTSTRPEGPGVLFWGNSNYPVNSAPVPTGWTKWSAVCVPKAGVERVRVSGMYFNHTSGTETGAQVWLAGLSLRPRVETSIIATGAIIAPHLNVVSEDPSGGRMELKPDGLRLYDPSGSESVSLTSASAHFLSIRDADGNTLASMDSEGGMIAQNIASASDPEFMGTPLMGNTSTESFPSEAPDGSGILDYMPRGIVARGYRAASSYKISNGEREIIELSYDHFPGRAYRIHVSPWSVYGSNGAYIYLKAYVGYNGARPKMGTNLLQVKTIRQGIESGNNVMYDMGTTWYDLSNASSAERRSYLFTFEALNGVAEVFGNGTDGSQFRVWVEDIGLAVPETGVIRSEFRSNGGSAPAPPTVIEPKNYSKTYQATGYRSYTSSGATYNYKTASMFQGQSPAGAGNLRSNAVFKSFTADLSGATITSVEAYFYFDHWYYNSGGTANIYLHADVDGVNSTIAPQTFAVSSSSWRAGTGRWVKIPSKFWNGFKTGEWRGVGLGGSGLSQYGYARGASTRIRIKYTK